jgi:hypothetical protein
MRVSLPKTFAVLVVGASLGACVERSNSTTGTLVDAGASTTDRGGSSINGTFDAMFGEGGTAVPPQGGTPLPGGQGGEAPPPVGGSGGDEPPPPPPDAGGTGGTQMMGDPGPCAARALDAHQACPASIYEVRQDIGLGFKVTVKGVVTTLRTNAAGEPRNLTLQVGAEQAEYSGPNFSGVWVFTGDATAPAEQLAGLQPGQLVEMTGTTNDFHGQRQLVLIDAVTIVGNAAPVVPLPVAPGEIATGGARADALEASLVEIEDVDVTNPAPPPGEGDRDPTHEFEVTGTLRVDDFLYLIDPPPVADERFRRITGVLRFSNNLHKIEPRNAADVDRPNAPPPPPPADMGAPPPPPADMGAPPPPPGDGPLLITEIDYDQMGTDSAEFVEIHNPSRAAVSLVGLSLELVNGNGGDVYRRFALSDAADRLEAGGYLVVGALAVTSALPAGVPSIPFNPNVADLNNSVLQNGPDAVRIVDAAGGLIDAFGYEGDVAGATEGDFLSGDPGNERPQSASRCPVDADTNDNATDFRYVTPSPGLASICM